MVALNAVLDYEFFVQCPCVSLLGNVSLVVMLGRRVVDFRTQVGLLEVCS